MADNAGLIHDVDCEYDSGRFILTNLPDPMPEVFTVRFTTPETFTQGDTIVAAGRELVLRTPANINASSAFFRANTVFHCDIDLTKNRAFTWSNINAAAGSGDGATPDMSYEEQYAGYKNWEGKKVYQKTFVLNGVREGAAGALHGIINFSTMIDSTVVFKFSSGNTQMMGNLEVRMLQNNITCPAPATGTLYITVYYTCTDR